MSEETPPTPESTVPVRDRRRRKRLVTKRTVGITIALVLAIFLAISIYFEMRTPASGSGSFGRLYSLRTQTPELPERAPYTVIPEREVRGQAGADPMLIDGMRREKFLGVEPGMLEKKFGINTETADPRLEGGTTPADPRLREGSVRITGGPEGVRIEEKEP
jgi:hypothetical protein